MSAVPVSRVTPEEYLAAERASDTKHEYVNGEVYAMAGASLAHNLIVSNLIRTVGTRLLGRPCDVYPSDMRLQVTETGLYTYPDVMVVCGEHHLADETRDMLVNPKVIFEVLSETTEVNDRVWKWAHYRHLESLEEYVLVAQDRHLVEHFARQPDGAWLLREFDDLGETLPLPTLGIEVPLADIYYRVPLRQQGRPIPEGP